MTDGTKMGGWPDPQRPGVPLHPERDGWHWLLGSLEAHPRPHLWLAEDGGTPCWWRPGHEVSAATMRHAAIYLGPCHTPSEVTAREAAARADALREAHRVCDKHAQFAAQGGPHTCDSTNGALWYGREQYARQCTGEIEALIEQPTTTGETPDAR